METLKNAIPFIHLLMAMAVVILAIGYGLKSFLNSDNRSNPGIPVEPVCYYDQGRCPQKREDSFTFAIMALVLIMLIAYSLYIMENMPVITQAGITN